MEKMQECRTFEELAVALMGSGVVFPSPEVLERQKKLADCEHEKFDRLRKRVLTALKCCSRDVKSCAGCPYDPADDCFVSLNSDIKDLVWAFDAEYEKLQKAVEAARKTSTLRFLWG